MDVKTRILEYGGRWYWAWKDGERYYAPMPGGGRTFGPIEYVCSAAYISRARKRDLVRYLRSIGYDQIEVSDA